MCEIAQVTRGGHYAWNTRELSLHAQKDQQIRRHRQLPAIVAAKLHTKQL
jgi:hypothetical protein